MSVTVPNGLIMMGTSLLFLDYIDRRFLISRDLAQLSALMSIKREVETYVKRGFTVADFWEERAAVAPHKVCLVFEGQSYTFLDVEQNVNRMAHFLIAQGVKKGDIVGVLMESRPQFIFIWIALSKIGAVSALLNYNQKGVTLWRSVQVSTARFLVFGFELSEQLAAVVDDVKKAGIITFCEGGDSPHGPNITKLLPEYLVSAPSRSIREGLTSHDPWGFIFTSGTTGFPKASIMKHFRVLIILCAFSRIFEVTPADRIYTPLPLYHTVAGLIGVGMMMRSTATLVLRRKFSSQYFLKDVIEHDCTIFLYSGEICRYLTTLSPCPSDTQHKIRLAMGNGLRPDIWETFQQRFNIAEIGEFYASTEGNVALSNSVKLDGKGKGAVGFLGPFSQRYGGAVIVRYDKEKEDLVRDEKGFCIHCHPNQTGELLGRVSGGSFSEFAGYYGNSEGTSNKFVRDVFKKGDLYFRTGDLLKRDSKGFMYFMDRVGDNYRWKGENISTNEVAEALSSFTEIQEVNVYGIQLPKQDGRVGMAAIVPKPRMEIDMAALARHACRELPSYAVPVFLRLMPVMHTTDTWKHTKVELRRQAINLHIIRDPIYILNPKQLEYQLLSEEKYREIMVGNARL